MKNTGMRNPFKRIELERWFGDNYECWHCGKNHWNCFHHAVGRGSGDSKCERSILNAVPLNNFECHLAIHGALTLDKNVRIMLQKTMRYLLKCGYEFNEIDKEFIIKYKKYYEDSRLV